LTQSNQTAAGATANTGSNQAGSANDQPIRLQNLQNQYQQALAATRLTLASSSSQQQAAASAGQVTQQQVNQTNQSAAVNSSANNAGANQNLANQQAAASNAAALAQSQAYYLANAAAANPNAVQPLQ
jgi:hypothetical protein